MVRNCILAWLAVVLCLACTAPRPVIRFDSVPPSARHDPFVNWYRPPFVGLEDFRRFDRTPLEVVSVEGAGAGVTGAKKAIIRDATSGTEMPLKIKRFPVGLDGTNNSPRRELATYAVQQLFLDPEEFVVPTAGVRCISPEVWEREFQAPPIGIPGTECALVVYSFWLRDVKLPEPLYEEERFLVDPRYALHLGNFNILAYLVDHRDNRQGNILVSQDDENRRVFAIDNGTTFGGPLFNWFYPPHFAWSRIVAPALPRKAVNRLSRLTRADLDGLSVLVQMEADDRGILRIASPGQPFDVKKGVRKHGTTLQLGLTEGEIDDVWERIEGLLHAVDDGEIQLF